MAQVQEAVELTHVRLPHPHLHHTSHHRNHHCNLDDSPEQSIHHQTTRHNEATASDGKSFPSADHSIEAWLFLLSAFIIEAMIWGFAFTYGIFQDYYSEHHLFRKHESSLATVGTAQSGIMYIGMLPMFYILLRFPRFRPWSMPVGLLISCGSLVAGSFASTVEALIWTQGVFYGVGGALIFCPCLLFLEEWFVRKLGLAFGIMWVCISKLPAEKS
jgi:hypothetical protein